MLGNNRGADFVSGQLEYCIHSAEIGEYIRQLSEDIIDASDKLNKIVGIELNVFPVSYSVD